MPSPDTPAPDPRRPENIRARVRLLDDHRALPTQMRRGAWAGRRHVPLVALGDQGAGDEVDAEREEELRCFEHIAMPSGNSLEEHTRLRLDIRGCQSRLEKREN